MYFNSMMITVYTVETSKNNCKTLFLVKFLDLYTI